MSKEKADMKKEKALTDVIRKEMTSNTNRRFLARMPAFRPDAELPERLTMLLGKLDRAERTR